jgi:hypothetical protein
VIQEGCDTSWSIVTAVLAVISPVDPTFGINRLDGFRRFLTLKHDIPSQDTFERIFEILQPQAWQRLFLDRRDRLPQPALPEGEREIIAIDGKTSRGPASPGLAALHTADVVSVRRNIVPSAAGVSEKTNEITVLPELIRMIAPIGAIIPTDAMGCQKGVARADREVPSADDRLALNKRHPNLEAEIERAGARQNWGSLRHFALALVRRPGAGKRGASKPSASKPLSNPMTASVSCLCGSPSSMTRNRYEPAPSTQPSSGAIANRIRWVGTPGCSRER